MGERGRAPLLKKLYYDRRVRFVFVGGLNTAVAYAFYALFVWLGIPAHIATVLMYPPSILHSYLWNKYFTFRTPGRSAAELARFVLVYIAQLLINMLLVYVFTNMLGMDAYLAGVLAIPVSVLTSYAGHSLFSFKRRGDETK